MFKAWIKKGGLFPLSLFVIFSVLLFSFKDTQGDRRISKRVHPLPPAHLKQYSFGYAELIADLLWLRYLQDLEYCAPKEWASQMEGKACSKGWGYQMLSSIHELAPKFRIPMAVGPMNLSVLQDDFDGAGDLFVLAAKAFPEDWAILYRAAYHFLYEGEDTGKAAYYALEASKYGGPWWLKSLASKLYQKEGQAELALNILQDYRETLPEGELRKSGCSNKFNKIDPETLTFKASKPY